jgi:tetratricopeptide (TPR) repeat protein
MRLEELLSFSRILASALLFLLISGLAPLLSSVGPQSYSKESLSQTKSRAETQHEIVMLLLEKKEYEKAGIEANKIFDMAWPESQEPLLLKELLILSDQFLRQGQALIGLHLIEKNSRRFKNNSSQIEILKSEGYLYKSLRQNDRALECFRKAQELELKR